MPFALVTIGLLLVITGFQNTYGAFGKELQGDLTGQNNFFYWLIALGVVGAIGYIKDLQTFSRMFMALILIAIILANKNFVNAFQSAIGSTASGNDTNNFSTSPVNFFNNILNRGQQGSNNSSGGFQTTEVETTGSNSSVNVLGDIGNIASSFL